jgi:hypothetical protein
MQAIEAVKKLITRPCPARQPLRPMQEVRSTHCGTCPSCSAEVRVKVTPDGADVFNPCRHLQAVEQRGGGISIVFGAAA